VTPGQPQIDPMQLNIAMTPVQVQGPQGQQEIRILLQVSDIAGMQFSLCLAIPAARTIMYKMREVIETAETTIIKPPSQVGVA
jgi:hypothetical protein